MAKTVLNIEFNKNLESNLSVTAMDGAFEAQGSFAGQRVHEVLEGHCRQSKLAVL